MSSIIKRKVMAYLTLIRPVGWAPFFFSAVFGVADAGFNSIQSVYWLLLILGPLTLGGIYTLNFYSDREVDRVSNVVKDVVMSKQPFVTGKVKPLEGLLFATALLSTGLVFAWLTDIEVFVLVVILIVIGIIYSFPPRLKAVPFGDVLANSMGAGFIPYAMGWSLFKDVLSMSFLPPLWLTLLIASTYLLTVIIDMESDRKAGLNTTAVCLGVGGTIRLSFAIYLFSLLAYATVLIEKPSLAYLLLLPFLARSPYAYYKLYKNPNQVYHVAKRAVQCSVIGVILILSVYSLLNLLGISVDIISREVPTALA